VKRILEKLSHSPLDSAFVDNDPFERASIAAQFPGITSWSIAELAAHLAETSDSLLTEEARRRPQMYREQQSRSEKEKTACDYREFLRSCNITINIRRYQPRDALRARELLIRSHRMNLGVLPVEEAIARLYSPDEQHIFVAEMNDIYGDMGRSGIIHLMPDHRNKATIVSLVISCRARARGLALALLVGMLRHPNASSLGYSCRYVSNGSNLPLRMLLMRAGFKPEPGTDELVLDFDRLKGILLPDWISIRYQRIQERTI
jgi:FkbH-like protein